MTDYTGDLDAELARLKQVDDDTAANVTALDSTVANLDTRVTNLTSRVAALENPAPPPPPPPPPVMPVAAFTLDRTTDVAPGRVVMTHACKNADHFQMDWGGGLPTPVGTVHPLTDNGIGHDYPNPGTYSLNLRAWRDSDGAEANAAATVVVTAAPVAGTIGKNYGGISLPLAQSPATDISRIAADGFGWYRFDVRIATISPTRGSFNWSAYDPTFAACAAAGLKVNAIIYMLPQWMNGNTNDKYQPLNNQDYADWCGAAAPHLYTAGVRSMELWNEQNWGFWLPTPDRARYVDMAIRAADAIHAAEPRMIVVSGGVSTADTEYQQGHTSGTPRRLRDKLKHWVRLSAATYTSPWPGCNQTLDIYGKLGLYAHVDAVGIHPYLDATDPSPTGGAEWCEWAGGAMRTTIGIIDKWAPEGKKLTVWNTESAGPRSTLGDTGQATRASHMFQAFNSWKMADGSPMRPRLGPVFWFTYRDWTGQAAREATFGLVDGSYNPHPARAAIMTELAKTPT